VFSHGWPLSADAWEAQMLFLAARGYRCVAHDRRGHGRSSQPWDGNEMDTYADDLAQLIAHLNLRDVMLVGHSTGGGEVTRYLGRYGTGRVTRAVLVGAVPPIMVRTSANPGGLPMDVFDDLRAASLADRSQLYKDLASGPFYGFNREGAKVSEGLIDSFWMQGMMAGHKNAYACIAAFSATDFTEDLKRIDVPTLILHGDDDQIVPIDASARRSVELVRNATNPDPSARPQDAAELCDALKRLLHARESAFVTAASGATGSRLAPDELSWQRAVSLTLAGATALSLHALLVSITPRELDSSEFTAFLVFGATPLESGKLMTQARFETMPTLMAAGGWTIAFFAYGLLRRHWRKEKLELSLPQQRLSGTRALMAMAILLNTLWVVRMALEAGGATWVVVYVPVLGGVLELVMLYLFWSAVLEALRIQRPLSREPLLWVGLALSLLPPSAALVSVLGGGSP